MDGFFTRISQWATTRTTHSSRWSVASENNAKSSPSGPSRGEPPSMLRAMWHFGWFQQSSALARAFSLLRTCPWSRWTRPDASRGCRSLLSHRTPVPCSSSLWGRIPRLSVCLSERNSPRSWCRASSVYPSPLRPLRFQARFHRRFPLLCASGRNSCCGWWARCARWSSPWGVLSSALVLEVLRMRPVRKMMSTWGAQWVRGGCVLPWLRVGGVLWNCLFSFSKKVFQFL